MKILIAEDEKICRVILEDSLQELGYDVIVTQDGNEAREALQKDNAPKLAVLGWIMPGIEGKQGNYRRV